MNVIEVDGLTKRYGSHLALDGVSFRVEKGEIFGILGPNGAGKTTAVESIVGMRIPDSEPSESWGSIRCGSVTRFGEHEHAAARGSVDDVTLACYLALER